MSWIIISLEKDSDTLAEKLNMFLNSDVYYHHELNSLNLRGKISNFIEQKKRILFIALNEERILNLDESLKDINNKNLFFVYNNKLNVIESYV